MTGKACGVLVGVPGVFHQNQLLRRASHAEAYGVVLSVSASVFTYVCVIGDTATVLLVINGSMTAVGWQIVGVCYLGLMPFMCSLPAE